MPNQVLCLGEALVDLVATESERSGYQARNYRLAPGGAVCNVAVGLARLGVKVGLITKLGTDPFGQFMLQFLKKEKVDTSQIKISKKDLTALVLVSLDKKRNPKFFFYGSPGADRKLSPQEIPSRIFQGVKIFHFGTISFSCEPVRSATLKAIDLAKKARCYLSFDPNLRFHLWKDPAQLKKISWYLIPEVDLLKLNAEELAFLTGSQNLKTGAKMMLDQGVKLVVVTLGAKGAFYATQDCSRTVAGFKFQPVDTTGAGDAFTAGMIFWLTRFSQFPPKEAELFNAVRFSNAFAGLSTLKFGAIDGLVSFRQVQQFLKKT